MSRRADSAYQSLDLNVWKIHLRGDSIARRNIFRPTIVHGTLKFIFQNCLGLRCIVKFYWSVMLHDN